MDEVPVAQLLFLSADNSRANCYPWFGDRLSQQDRLRSRERAASRSRIFFPITLCSSSDRFDYLLWEGIGLRPPSTKLLDMLSSFTEPLTFIRR